VEIPQEKTLISLVVVIPLRQAKLKTGGNLKLLQEDLEILKPENVRDFA